MPVPHGKLIVCSSYCLILCIGDLVPDASFTQHFVIMYRIIFIIFLLSYSTTFAQQRTLENTVLVCQYHHTACRDTLTLRSVEDRMTLRIGENCSVFYSDNTYYADSLNTTPQGRRVWSELLLAAIKRGRPQERPGATTTSEYIYKNYPKNKITTRTLLLTSYVTFNEPYETQAWQLADSTKLIAGYVCRKATTSFRGRDYIAWYAEEIPIADGPWKFGGLPGLIMEVYDSTAAYRYRLIALHTTDLPPVELWDFSNGGYQPTTRRKYLQAMASIYFKGGGEQLISSLTDGLLGSDSQTARPILRYDFIERDYYSPKK